MDKGYFCFSYNIIRLLLGEGMNIRNVVNYLKKLKKENPNQVIIVETPKGTVKLKIGDALIYEGMGGEIVIDSE